MPNTRDLRPPPAHSAIDELIERAEQAEAEVLELREALNDPALLHWLGSSDVIEVSPAVARAVSAIHRVRATLSQKEEG